MAAIGASGTALLLRVGDDQRRGDRESARATASANVLAAAFACGIAAGWMIASPIVWPWLLATTVLIVLGLLAVARWQVRAWWSLIAATVTFGGGWVTVVHFRVTDADLASMIGEAPVLVTVKGTARSSPMIRDRAAGSMAVFSYQEPASYFQMQVDTLVGRDGVDRNVTGNILVRCDETLAPLRPGDRVVATGRLRRFPPPANPGEFNRERYARILGQAGMLQAPERELIRVVRTQRTGAADMLADFRERFRRRASAWVLDDLPPADRTERESLLAALLLGERGPDLTDLSASFRRVGLAHILAISGLHLGVLAGIVLLALRFTGQTRRWHALVVIGAIGLYLLLIEARLPVLRAALMTAAACAGILLGQRLRLRGLVALSAIALLLWKPQQLFDAGFQLSFATVLGLVYFSAPVRRRWFGPSQQLAGSTTHMLVERLRGLVAGSVVAWAIATPLVAYHFGLIAPLAAPLSVVALPLVTILLAVGYCKMILAALAPSISLLLAAPLAVLADLLVSIVQAIDALPFSFLRAPYPSAAWTIGALVVVALWFRHASRGEHETRSDRRTLFAATAILTLWLLWPILPFLPRPHLRVDMLSVGDGSCYVVRSGGSAVVFDAGRQVVIPAFERLNVRSIDAIVISHANLDHFSAAIELIDRFDVGTVLVTPQFLGAAERAPLGPAAHLLEQMTDRFVSIESIGAGESRTFGHATWTWLHPARDSQFDTVNDESMVIRVETAGRRILLTGDAQRDAIRSLLDSQSDLRADIVELPHHGSFDEPAVQFIQRVRPRFVMQSTGWTRFERDQWSEVLASQERLITARDGACSVEIDRDGRITTRRFIERSRSK